MKKSEAALACFVEGFSCSQSVLSAFAAEMGLERDIALKVAGSFGGGMGRMGGTCGAVTGAFMALGLRYAKLDPSDNATRDKGYEMVKEFASKFAARHGSITCRELIGCDLSTSEGQAQAKEKNVFELKCRKFVYDAAEILEEMLERGTPCVSKDKLT